MLSVKQEKYQLCSKHRSIFVKILLITVQCIYIIVVEELYMLSCELECFFNDDTNLPKFSFFFYTEKKINKIKPCPF